MRIKTKIALFIIAPIFVTDLAVSLVNGIGNYNALKALAEEKFLSHTENIALKIARENENGVSVSRTAATAANVWFADRSNSTTYIRELLQIFPAFIGASIGYEVNADLNDFRSERGIRNLRDGREATFDDAVDSYNFRSNPTSVSYDEWLAKSEGGRFAAYWNRAKGDLELEPLVDMGSSMYSAGLKKKLDSGSSEHFIVTEPYLYNNKVLMVEYSAPILQDGRFMGQVAFDRDLTNFSNFVANLKTSAQSEIFLLSSQARIIACTKNQNLRTLSIYDLYTDDAGAFVMSFLRDENGRLVRDDSAGTDVAKLGTSYRDILSSAFDKAKNAGLLSEGERAVSYFKDSKTKRSYCVSQALIRPGNWVVVQIMPQSEVLAPVYAYIRAELIEMGVFALIFIASILFANAILRRVTRATAVADEIAAGNFDVEITVSKSNDETSQLLLSMSNMARKLRTSARQIEDSQTQLESASASIERVSANCESAIADFGKSASSVSHAVRSIGDNAAELSKNAESVCAAANDASEMAENGRRNVSLLNEIVSGLSANTSAIARRFSIISERANSVNSVVTAVSKVADETNLLSLNASIEAEKAGSYGVGFAVVAREIGRLAEQTAVATSDIDAIMKEMKSAVDAGAAEVKNFAAEVEGAAGQMASVVAAMDSAITKIQSVAPQVESLSGGIGWQRESVSDINANLANLDAGMEHTSELIRLAVESRERLRAAVVRMREDIKDIKPDSSNNG